MNGAWPARTPKSPSTPEASTWSTIPENSSRSGETREKWSLSAMGLDFLDRVHDHDGLSLGRRRCCGGMDDEQLGAGFRIVGSNALDNVAARLVTGHVGLFRRRRFDDPAEPSGRDP